jgi:hypothetical protein
MHTLLVKVGFGGYTGLAASQGQIRKETELGLTVFIKGFQRACVERGKGNIDRR